jgi:hypothetical protein
MRPPTVEPTPRVVHPQHPSPVAATHQPPRQRSDEAPDNPSARQSKSTPDPRPASPPPQGRNVPCFSRLGSPGCRAGRERGHAGLHERGRPAPRSRRPARREHPVATVWRAPTEPALVPR